jgi:acyl carrier protein
MEEDVKSQIIAFITANFLFDNDKSLDETVSLLETGVIDSTGVLELVAYIEETYGLSIDDDEIVPENLDSVENITAFVTRRLSLRASLQSDAGEDSQAAPQVM